MKIKKLIALFTIPLLLTGCDLNFELYNPDDSNIQFVPSSPSLEGKEINVINPSNYNGTITYASENQTLLTKEEVYNLRVSSTVYITASISNGYKLGSGVFFSEDDNYGYIFTNAHVVEGSTSIEVVYSNYKRDTASLIGYNLLEDVAVLAVNKNNNYTIPSLQTSDKLSPGMDVLAIGTPASIEYSFSATSGIISKVDSPIASAFDESYGLLLLQTDASLNNGNSGGPLFDMYGNLLGLNSLKLLYDDAGNAMDDLNFSIPMERAVFMATSFFQNKPYTRGKLGLTIMDVVDMSNTEKLLYEIDFDYGIYVIESTNASFLTNDVITKINGIDFVNKIQFQKELYNHYNNEQIEFTVYREGEYIIINSTLQ